MINIVRTKLEHLSNIKPNEKFSGDEGAVSRVRDMLSNENVFSYTLKSEGNVLAILGITVGWAGVGEVWSVMTDKVSLCPVAFARSARHLLHNVISDLDLDRAHVFARCGFPDTIKWLEFLGFTKEATLEKFGPEGDDYLIYKLIPERLV